MTRAFFAVWLGTAMLAADADSSFEAHLRSARAMQGTLCVETDLTKALKKGWHEMIGHLRAAEASALTHQRKGAVCSALSRLHARWSSRTDSRKGSPVMLTATPLHLQSTVDPVDATREILFSDEQPPKDPAVIRSAIEKIEAQIERGYDRKKGLQVLELALVSLVNRSSDSKERAWARGRRLEVLRELSQLDPRNRGLALMAINAQPDLSARVAQLDLFLTRHPTDVDGLESLAQARGSLLTRSAGDPSAALSAFRRWASALDDDGLVAKASAFSLLRANRVACDDDAFLAAVSALESVGDEEAQHVGADDSSSLGKSPKVSTVRKKWKSERRLSTIKAFRASLSALRCDIK